VLFLNCAYISVMLFSLSLLLPVLILVQSVIAQPVRFEIGASGGSTRCQFLVRSPFENAVGTTHEATGFVLLDPSARSDTGAGLILVKAASFTTGSGWRDKKMKSSYLEVDNYPEIRFDIMSITCPRPLAPGLRTKVEVTGLYTLHGVTREVKPETYLTYSVIDSMTTLRIEAAFEEELSTYHISVPRFLFFKGGDYQKVTVDISAVAPKIRR